MLLIKEREWKTDSHGFQFRTDASGTVIVPRALEIRENRIFDRKTAPLGIEQMVPTEVSLPFGVKTEVIEYSDQVGEAQIATGNNSDIPFADSNMVEETEKIIKIREGYRYTQEEWDSIAEASKFQMYGRNGNISVQRQKAALKALSTKEHLIGCFGATGHGVRGFYNSNEVPVYQETTLDPYDSATTAQNLLDWYVETLVGSVRDITNLTERPNTIVQTEALTRKMATTQVQNGAGEGNGVTALDLVTDALSQIGTPVTILSRNESSTPFLDKYGITRSAADHDRLVVYCRDPECLDRKVSPVRLGDWETYQTVYSRIMDQNIRGVRWHYAQSALYVDIPKP